MQMDYEEAKRQLLLHTGVIDEARKAIILEDGFLPSLRPYRGLLEKNFHLVMEALLTAGERIHLAPQVDRELIKTVWWMCATARLWALRSHGMLQANKLITPEDSLRMELWVDTIEETALSLLGGSSPHKAVYHYAKYVAEVGWWDNIAFFLHLMDRAVADPHTVFEIEMILKALIKLGGLAKPVLPTLREAQQRTLSSSTPQLDAPSSMERHTESIRLSIERAIHTLESVED
jgi:hypothetical protein